MGKNGRSKNLSDDDAAAWDHYVKHLHHRPFGFSYRPSAKKRINPSKMELDLHGLTVHDAYLAVMDFIDLHILAGSVSIVIICGKGGKISDELEHWCRLHHGVKDCRPIKDSKGEHGSYTVRLKKR